MGFKSLTARVRKDPFAFTLLNQLVANQQSNEAIQLYEHAPDGTHNALEVARATATIVNSSGTYSLEGESTDAAGNKLISAVTKNGTGDVTLTLKSGYFLSTQAPRLQSMADADLPHALEWEVVSATSVRIRIYRCENLTGNAWSAADANFCIAIHCEKFTPSSSAVSVISNAKRGDTLGDGASERWNLLVQNAADLNARALIGHTSSGVHDTREVAKGLAIISYSAGVALDDSENVTSVSRSAAGKYALTLPGAPSAYTTPLQVFATAGAISSGQVGPSAAALSDVVLVNVRRDLITSTNVTLHLYGYSYSGNDWAFADGDVRCTIHGG